MQGVSRLALLSVRMPQGALGYGDCGMSAAGERYEAALAAASARYRDAWAQAQKLPTFAEAREAAYAAERKRIEAWQRALDQYRDEQS